MIFFDESGQRWRRLKRSGVTMMLFGLIPLLALIGGSLAYQPRWGMLPLIKQATTAALSGNTKPHTDSSPPVYTQPAQQVQSSAKAIATQVAYQPAATTNPTTPPNATATSSSGTTSPPTTTSQPKSASPKGGDPVQNDFGHSHQPTR